jgi:hypothetical protein
MHPRERIAYSAINDRTPLKLPGGLRLIVWPVLALEEWDMSRPMARYTTAGPADDPGSSELELAPIRQSH